MGYQAVGLLGGLLLGRRGGPGGGGSFTNSFNLVALGFVGASKASLEAAATFLEDRLALVCLGIPPATIWGSGGAGGSPTSSKLQQGKSITHICQLLQYGPYWGSITRSIKCYIAFWEGPNFFWWWDHQILGVSPNGPRSRRAR